MAPKELPKWVYKAPRPDDGEKREFPQLDGMSKMDLGSYRRESVTNLDGSEVARSYFDLGLQHMLSYQHEMASKCFLACLEYAPYCVLAHVLVALCHSPNYNFKGDAYYESTHHEEEVDMPDLLCVFPSQQLSDRHSGLAVRKLEQIRRFHRKANGKKGKGKQGKKNNHSNGSHTETSESPPPAKEESEQNPEEIPAICTDVEVQVIQAVRVLSGSPGINTGLSEELVGRPYADAMRKVYQKYPDDPEVAWFFAEALMVLNAWKLYEYPTGRPLSPDVEETRAILESSLTKHPTHGGLCHMYVHLSEMSADPGKALSYCEPLRKSFPHAGHLIHMPTHIDVLVGDYESCVRWNYAAILADDACMKASPSTAGTVSFYFGYIVHNYHMLCYGCILGGMEQMAMKVAEKLNTSHLSEHMFAENPDLTAYLESYSALEVHVMVRFGRWRKIIDELEDPKDKSLMLFRAASVKFAKSLAYANTGELEKAKKEADRFDSLRKSPNAKDRILHNNSVYDLLAVDAPMLRGEIAYREGRYEDAFKLLRQAVEMQDNLNYDEPWGKMQPIRHALGGLLLEQGHLVEAEVVFRSDLELHPKNPWGLKGLIQCLERKTRSGLLDKPSMDSACKELPLLVEDLAEQRKSEWADFTIRAACECCRNV